MAKIKPSKKTLFQSIGQLLWLLIRNTYITYLKLLIKLKGKDSINLEIESMIDGFQHPARKWLSMFIFPLLKGILVLEALYFINVFMYLQATECNENREIALWSLGILIGVLFVAWSVIHQKSWNFCIGDFSFKRIYRNSEGHIIPLLGGVLALAVFYSINTLMFKHVTKSDVICVLLVFIDILLLVSLVIYQLKKANLRNDIAKNFTKIFMKHLAPYPHVELLQLTNKGVKGMETEIKGMEIENRNFYVIINIDLKVENLIEKYLACKNIDFVFNEKEIDSDINFKVKENIRIFILKKLDEISEKDRKKMAGQLSLPFEVIIALNKDGCFCFIKEGNPENPKNFIPCKVDIEENKPPFVILETLKSTKEGQKFLDINAQQISYVEYQKDGVELTILQPNDSPKKITVSLSEWLANRNDLR